MASKEAQGKVRTARAWTDGAYFYASFKPALTPSRLKKVEEAAPPVHEYFASKRGRIKHLSFELDRFEPGLDAPKDFLAHLGHMAASANYEVSSDQIEIREPRQT